MQITSSYGVELRKQNIPIRQTLEIYRSAVSYLTEIYGKVWKELAGIPDAKRRFNAAEHLVHTTKKNQARFDFDNCFPKMPSYLRRAAIRHALGSVSSFQERLWRSCRGVAECTRRADPSAFFHWPRLRSAGGFILEEDESRLEQWERTAEKAGKPALAYENHAMPVFYRDVMYRESAEGKEEADLKLYDGHDWKWFRVRLKHTDMEYLRKNWSGKKASAPTLEKRHHKYFLRFSYTEEITLTETPVKEQVICSVDLGINTDAVCTLMQADGTILGRRFINFSGDKDRMYRTLGRIRRFQREHGSAQSQGRWAYTKRLNTELGRRTAGAIVDYAEENHADVIVFEYLKMQGKIPGKKKQKLHLWRKRDIQKRCEHQAHRKGIRISRVCAWNTSRLAYDGSGMVRRDQKNHSLCTFVTGKRYHCDLSASYNIGARYFIRELLKPLPATERSLLEAKVPPVKRRTSCVYADLKELSSKMSSLKAS